MLLRTWLRLTRPRRPTAPPAGLVPSSAAALAAAEPTFSPDVAAVLAALQADLGRLSPQLAAGFADQAPTLIGQLGEPVFIALCRALNAASATRHTARLTDIVAETCQVVLALRDDEARCQALVEAALPLYATQPLLGAAALRAAAEHLALTADGFAQWLSFGLARHGANPSHLAAFARLETAQARSVLEAYLPGLPLEEAAPTLRHYLRALTGRSFRLAPSAGAADVGGQVRFQAQVHQLALPRRVALFSERDRNFLLYKLLAAQGAGRLLFGSYAEDTPPLRVAYETMRAFFADLGAGAGGLSHVDFAVIRDRAVERRLPPRPGVVTAEDALALFPDVETARTLFDVVEMARVLRRLRRAYRGVARDADALTAPLLASRQSLAGAPLTTAAVELLFRLALAGEVGPAVQAEYAALTKTLTDALAPCLAGDATVADSLQATLDIYRLLPPPSQPRWSSDAPPSNGMAPQRVPASGTAQPNPSIADAAGQSQSIRVVPALPGGLAQSVTSGNLPASAVPPPDDATPPPSDGLPGDQPLVPRQASWRAVASYRYPEWDVRLGEYRPDWCQVSELDTPGDLPTVPVGDSATVARLRRAFERWRPADLAWVRPTTDGSELALDALIERHVERRAQPWASDAVYARRQRMVRSVAALLLLDVSRSTGEPMAGAAPRRVLDGEVESVRCLAAALEQIGDRFAIYAFNSQGKDAVRCFRLKAFDERAERLAGRLTALAPASNTRLGAAIRHATRLLLAEAARSRLLLVVTDGLPHDSDYGDVTYAVADTAQAVAEAQAVGIRALGVALDAGQDAALLDTLFGRGRYARLREASRLPDALPRLYRRWAV
ncbi:VWA domain-containing protein [Chloracidobacterium validum]|uniref:VWA domain-containing protein n=1 Tax=Chloracidobacterium validum TaxID=2821543 RepID=A0ABX8B9L0_9BACT|nr:VWA domain-containing protein [Chloracidobacterium validum]QUW03623.1 VWA domain-containing protein [Chloracidobacterium validum]